jgi:hypothetical protein
MPVPAPDSLLTRWYWDWEARVRLDLTLVLRPGGSLESEVESCSSLFLSKDPVPGSNR